MLQINYEDWGYGPPHPGAVVRDEILPRLDLSRDEFARKLGVSMASLADVLSEAKPVTLDLARRLGQAFGTGARYWLALQMQHDVWAAEREGTLAVERISMGSRPRKAA